MNKNGRIRIFSLIFIILIIIALVQIYKIYKENYFGDFVKAEYQLGLSEFKRDANVKINNHNSYRITSNVFNDAMYYKKVSVEPNTPYRVTCKVKTENVVTELPVSNAGAGICILDTTECSDTITGTRDWTELEFMFDSKARTEISIGFRLGSYADNCKGTAWFTDLKLERGAYTGDSNWKMVCFIFDEIDVTVQKNGTPYRMHEKMTEEDKQVVRDNMERTKQSFKEFSNYQMTMDYEIIEIADPVKAISFDDENGYYVSSSDVSGLIKEYVQKGEYDFIYSVVKFGEIVDTASDGRNNWIGLGGMNYHDIGFANINLPSDEKNYIFKYSPSINLFPEEAFVHEFLHTMENISKDNGFDYPILHDYEKYGYKMEPLVSIKKWYIDYMSNNITLDHGIKIGIDPKAYKIKPIHKLAFIYSAEIEFDNDPDNIIEEIRAIFKTLFDAGKTVLRKEANNT